MFKRALKFNNVMLDDAEVMAIIEKEKVTIVVSIKALIFLKKVLFVFNL